MPRRNDDEEDRPRRPRGRVSNENPPSPEGPGPAPRRPIAEPTTDYRGSGEFDRESGLQRTLETRQMIPRNHFANEDEWAEYFATVPQEIKRAHRENARANQERVYAGLQDGLSLEDLGITDEKEHGRALFRRLSAYGLLDPNMEYNWDTRMKRNVGTSDLNARNRWMAIDPSEMEERRTHQQYGGDFAARMRDYAGNRMSKAIGEGVFTRDANGLLYNDPQNDASRRQYYDDRGYFIDPTTRQRIGGGHSGFVYGQGRQQGAGVFGGVGGSWGQNTPAAQPAGPPKNPYYRQQPNPWGSPNKPQNQFGMTGFGGTPLKMKKTFGAPV